MRHVTRIGEKKNHLEDLGIGGIILKWLQKEYDEHMWNKFDSE